MNVSTKQQRIAELAKHSPELSFTSLNHYLDLDWLKEAYRRLRKDSAPGCDAQTVLDRAKSGRYVAPPVRRAHIPKGTGQETRPIGVPTTEDKLLQRAVAMLLEPIYEQDFLDCSYGFRSGRSAHGALEDLGRQSMDLGVQWILDVDISKFFDTLDHAQLRQLLQHRVRDGVITRLVGKWLNAGVLEQGAVHYPEQGTPQGGSISPLLSNLYLHYVLDLWFATEVQPRMKSRTFMTRFADDVVMGFECPEDAERVLRVLQKRFAKYGLTLHPDKTRLVAFGRPNRPEAERPGTFDFLGFTHYWGRSRKGKWVIKRKTARTRFNRGLKHLSEWCRSNRHRPVAEQHAKLRQKLTGHFAYYGITGNGLWLQKFVEAVKKIWQKWLSRRSRGAPMPWVRFQHLLRRYPLPPVRVVHSIYVAKP
jgi:RNA-directed DNA polymerase